MASINDLPVEMRGTVLQVAATLAAPIIGKMPNAAPEAAIEAGFGVFDQVLQRLIVAQEQGV